MQAVKLLILGTLMFVLIRYAPVYYHTSEFNSYVQFEVLHIRSKKNLKAAILRNAEQNNLPIKDKNIKFASTDSVISVNVEYQMPLDLIIFQKDLTFRAAGIGLPIEN